VAFALPEELDRVDTLRHPVVEPDPSFSIATTLASAIGLLRTS
jgi:hypothetical protein